MSSWRAAASGTSAGFGANAFATAADTGAWMMERVGGGVRGAEGAGEGAGVFD